MTELATPETLICRCEELTMTEIEADPEPGSTSIGALKRRTRSGMGRCQGRYCGPILAALSAARAFVDHFAQAFSVMRGRGRMLVPEQIDRGAATGSGGG